MATRKKPLPERFVQDAVAERLNEQYYRRKPVFESTEVYTRLKRADVLLAFMRARGRPYVVVVEAKSRTTIHQLKLKQDAGRVRWLGRFLSLVVIVGLSAALGYQWYFNALNTLLLLLLFMVGAAGISALAGRLQLRFLGSVSAIDQLGRYPANESWIAVGEDTFARPADYQTLRDQCRKAGVGLIVVTEKGRLRLREYPRPRHTFNDYLSRYGKRKEILAKIDRNPRYGPTPPERRKTRRQLFRAALLLAGVGLLGTLGYEENYGPVVPDPFTESIFDELPASAPADLPTDPFGEEDTPTGDCSVLTVTQRSFLVADAILNADEARLRSARLSAAGISGHALVAADCLNSWPEAGRYLVWTGTLYPNRPLAAAAARRYRELLARLGLEAPYGKPVKVYPGNE